MLTKYVPEDHKQDLDYIVSMIDWDANIDPNFKRHHLLYPRAVKAESEMADEGLLDYWIVYGGSLFASKESTVLPGRTVTMRDPGAYSLIAVQGRGELGRWALETPALIRFGQLTQDEYFVSAEAAQQGVVVHNPSETEPIVMLKTFGPGTGQE